MKEISFNDIYEKLFPVVFKYVRLRVPYSDIEDVSAEIMAKIWKALPNFEGRSSLKSWAIRIASNSVADYYRNKKDVTILPISDELQEVHTSRDYGEELATVLSVSKTLSKLTEPQVAVIQLRLVEGFSASETASILGITQQAVDSLLYRAKRNFRNIYSAEMAGGEI